MMKKYVYIISVVCVGYTYAIGVFDEYETMVNALVNDILLNIDSYSSVKKYLDSNNITVNEYKDFLTDRLYSNIDLFNDIFQIEKMNMNTLYE